MQLVLTRLKYGGDICGKLAFYEISFNNVGNNRMLTVPNRYSAFLKMKV